MLNLSPTYMEIPKVKYPPSICEPNSCMSVQQIIERHLSGLPVSEVVTCPDEGFESDEENHPTPFPDDEMFDILTADVNSLDLVELEEARSYLSSRSSDIKKRLDYVSRESRENNRSDHSDDSGNSVLSSDPSQET